MIHKPFNGQTQQTVWPDHRCRTSCLCFSRTSLCTIHTIQDNASAFLRRRRCLTSPRLNMPFLVWAGSLHAQFHLHSSVILFANWRKTSYIWRDTSFHRQFTFEHPFEWLLRTIFSLANLWKNALQNSIVCLIHFLFLWIKQVVIQQLKHALRSFHCLISIREWTEF